MRYKYVYAVFPRAYGKSFLSILTLMIKCILFPRSKLFVTSGGKEQSASIVREKVNELCTLVPALNRELDRRPGKTREGKDYVKYVFKNGSYFDNVAASERSRGQRRHAGLIEECVGVDGDILSQVILPMMKSGLFSLAILTLIEYWNVVEPALVFLQDIYKAPLSVFLSEIGQNQMGLIFAASCLYMLPILLSFLYGQDYLIEGIELSGVKG